jgi:hypothetical protein
VLAPAIRLLLMAMLAWLSRAASVPATTSYVNPRLTSGAGGAGNRSDRVSRPHLLLEKVVHTGGRQFPEVGNEPGCGAGLGTWLLFQQPCTLNKGRQCPDSPGLCSRPATRCSDTRGPDCTRARSCCLGSATWVPAGPRRLIGQGGCAVPLTRRLPEHRSERCRDRAACHDQHLFNWPSVCMLNPTHSGDNLDLKEYQQHFPWDRATLIARMSGQVLRCSSVRWMSGARCVILCHSREQPGSSGAE